MEVWTRIGEKGTNAGRKALEGLSEDELDQLDSIMDRIYENIRRK